MSLNIGVTSLTTEGWWDTLNDWSSTAFILAGVLFVVDTVFMLVDLLAGVTISGGIFVAFFVSALIVTLFGTLGIYPSLAERTPRLALASTVPIAVAGITLPVVFVWAIIASLLNRPLPPAGVALFIIALIFLGLLVFGVAIAQAETPSRTSGFLLLMLVATWITWFAGFGIWGAHHLPDLWSPAFSILTSTITLGIGYALYTTPAME